MALGILLPLGHPEAASVMGQSPLPAPRGICRAGEGGMGGERKSVEHGEEGKRVPW